MWTIIIFAAITIIISWLFVYGENGDFEDYFSAFLLGLFMGGTVGLCVALALPAKTEIVKTTYNLEALQDNNNVKGSFFLGSGQIDGEMMYVFYYESDGYYKLKQVDYEEAKIKYSDDKPKVEQFSRENAKNSFVNNFAIDWCCWHREYIIYVPKGTINHNYTLDAQ